VPALPLGAASLSSGVVAALIVLGVVVAIFGHLAGSRRTAATGIAILFAASLLMIAGAYLAYHADPSDPRPCATPGTC
jgi:formate hydrogenlyase subunit 3/multisubunit Na+/H+ antiporter MnhD subunit